MYRKDISIALVLDSTFCLCCVFWSVKNYFYLKYFYVNKIVIFLVENACNVEGMKYDTIVISFANYLHCLMCSSKYLLCGIMLRIRVNGAVLL